ncbi:hypothetical protein QAD02_009512 [Eretmocerus hayati]|uniref:Uncharacterized protein n=1 Tax=Eretmocerus hayati TaxID=131215 RepID=A0ACC2NC29_9HYME|nr:hypothetical protein QAD02_009512 [Eretmocerus hayati]
MGSYGSDAQIVNYEPLILVRLIGNPYPATTPAEPDPSFDQLNIDFSPWKIGRGLSSDSTILCAAISKDHCHFDFDPCGQWMVTNTSSVGTSINGIPLLVNERKVICLNDTLELGDSGYFKYTLKKAVRVTTDSPPPPHGCGICASITAQVG